MILDLSAAMVVFLLMVDGVNLQHSKTGPPRRRPGKRRTIAEFPYASLAQAPENRESAARPDFVQLSIVWRTGPKNTNSETVD